MSSKIKKRFIRSQNAHKRLMKYHKHACEKSKGIEYDKHFINMNYHSNIIHRQEKAKRIYEQKEREKVYSSVVRDFY